MRYLRGVLVLLAAALSLSVSEAQGQPYFSVGLGAGVESISTRTTVKNGETQSIFVVSEAEGMGSFLSDGSKGLKASFALNVGIGYMFSEKLGLGASLGYHLLRRGSSGYSKIAGGGKAGETSIKGHISVHSFTLLPYLRVAPVHVGGFSLYFDCGVPLEFGSVSSSSKETKGSIDNQTKDDLGSVVVAGVGVVPGLMYSFTDRVALFANLRFLNVGYTYTQYKPDKQKLSPNATVTERYHQFNLGKLADGMELGLRILL